MKKLFALLLCLCMVFALVSCNETEGEGEGEGEGISQFVKASPAGIMTEKASAHKQKPLGSVIPQANKMSKFIDLTQTTGKKEK